MAGRNRSPRPLTLLRVLPFFVPRHLDGLELRLVGGLGIVVEAVKRENAVAEVREPDRQGIDVGELLGQRDADVFGVGPLHGVTPSALRSFLSDLPSWMPPPSWT